MARGETFLELQGMLREELGRSPDVAIGVDDLPILKRAINKAYATLYDEYDWPFLRRVFAKESLSAGQRYYDLPDGLNIERVEAVYIWFNEVPQKIDRGITVDEYGIYDPTDNVRVDPVLLWDVRNISGSVQIEVWPLPASDTMSIQFVGLVEAPKLVNNADACLLDDELVVMLAAAQHLRRQKSADADDALAQFRARIKSMKSRSAAGGNQRVRVGLGDMRGEDDRRISRAKITIAG